MKYFLIGFYFFINATADNGESGGEHMYAIRYKYYLEKYSPSLLLRTQEKSFQGRVGGLID